MVKLQPLLETHLTYRVQLLNNPEISKTLNVSESFDIEKTTEWFQHRNLKNRFDCVFEHDNQVIGMGGLSSISCVNRNAELYIYIDPQFQGKGFGKQSLIELCKYGFNEFNLHKIWLYTFSSNERANAMYEKVGFICEGYLREHTMKDNSLQDRFIYGLLAEDFTEYLRTNN